MPFFPKICHSTAVCSVHCTLKGAQHKMRCCNYANMLLSNTSNRSSSCVLLIAQFDHFSFFNTPNPYTQKAPQKKETCTNMNWKYMYENIMLSTLFYTLYLYTILGILYTCECERWRWNDSVHKIAIDRRVNACFFLSG